MKYICPLPWVGFSNDPNGTVRPCCINSERITDKNGNPYFIQNTSVKDIFHSEYMNKLRQDFSDGKKPASCSTCWKDESNGYKSKRLIYTDIHHEYIDEFNYRVVPEYPLDYQLILTNACNLKCRSCGTSHSTSWQKEVKGMSEEHSRAIGQFKYDLPHGQAGNKESVFIDDIDEWAPKVKRLEVVGGEPFYTAIWEKIWNYMIEKGYSTNIDLAMSTNCSVMNIDLVDKLNSNFKNVGIGLSIDGIGDTFEYLRKNAFWDETQDNILKYYKFYKEKGKGVTGFNFTYTISWINAIEIPEFHTWVKQNTPEFRIWNNIVHYPPHMTLYNIPDITKKEIEKKLSNFDWGVYTTDIQALVEHMYSQSPTKEELKKLYKRFTILDKYRKESTKDLVSRIYPEMGELFDD
jgi:MoaA/NifB/PqqE/SkfB family radical SAM enzyme